MKFVDSIQLHLKAGQGGSGIVSFFQDWQQKTPRADGGNGGNGGSIIFISSEKINSFNHFRFNEVISASNGESGDKSKRHGKNAKDVKLYVPLGTIVFTENKKQILFNFEKNNETYTIVKGGIGGKGNAAFVSNQNKRSIYSQSGTLGEIRTARLELKMIAKVGIIGLPNAGKSSLLAALTNAHPRIANYRFTTMFPNLGILINQKNERILIADLPGIIEGAAENKGLGNQFLKHAERCYLLLHLIDLNVDNIDVFHKKFTLINQELLNYNEHFSEIQRIIIGNKIDLFQAKQIFTKLKKQSDFFNHCDFIAVSAKENTGINHLAKKILEFFSSTKEWTTIMDKTISNQKNYDNFVYQHSLESEIRLRKIGKGIWELSGSLMHKLCEKYNFKDSEDLKKINQHFKKHGIVECLSDHGIKKGDIVYVYDFQFEWKF